MTTVLIPMAEGVEEMEAVILIDVWRRAGWQVVAAAVTPMPIRASRGVRLLADAEWETACLRTDFDLLALPGGLGGTEALCKTPSVLEAVRRFHSAGKYVAAICAAPLVLQAAGILDGVRATCHPGTADQLTATRWSPERVVRDGRLFTSQGPGTAFEFALALVAEIDGTAARDDLARGLVLA